MVTGVLPDRASRLLFGSVRRDILALLLGRPDERFYLREIQRAVNAGIGPVQRELKQLSDAGLVHREARGNNVFFSANRDAPIFAELQSIVQKTAGAPEVLRASLAEPIAAGRIVVAFIYGSVAAGTQTSSSDVDLLIVGDVTLSEIVPAVRMAEARVGRDVNPSVYSAGEFRAKARQGAGFLKRILAKPKLFVAGDDRALGRLAR
jgi:hypothetical protein